ncbi:hypothetical protein AVEN_269746-1 [Araneus ventricosus]|uniref:Uncharacterized protein n=1 Tax=Araneus ventricosus TaxID=182803 RepID=A0A4Y2EF63_ARAVE|nr:hypothetical protein AVEN_269746-1 [Araneus ventricosus]
MTRTTPELAPPLQTSGPHQCPSILEDSKPYGSSVESGLEPGTEAETLPLGHRGPCKQREKVKDGNINAA